MTLGDHSAAGLLHPAARRVLAIQTRTTKPPASSRFGGPPKPTGQRLVFPDEQHPVRTPKALPFSVVAGNNAADKSSDSCMICNVRPHTTCMNESEARYILDEQLARFSDRTHSELAALVEAKQIEAYEVRAASGTVYQVEIQFFWDDRRGNTIRVMGCIDDGGVRALVPLTESILIAPTSKSARQDKTSRDPAAH